MVSEQTLAYLDSLGQAQRPNMWERPEEVARSVLEAEPNENQVTDSDTTKANLNPLELRSFRAIAGTINLAKYAEANHGWDLAKVISFLRHENIVTTVPSRAKSGWATAMAKTQTNVNRNEIKEEAVAIQEKFDGNQSVLSKIPIVGKFMKK